MNKKVLLALFFVLICISTIGAVQASDVNLTDSDTVGVSDNVTLQLEDKTQFSNSESNLSATMNETPLSDPVKNQTELSSQKSSIYYKGSYGVVLKDSSANTAIANKKIKLVIDDAGYTAMTDGSGVASLNLQLAPGKYSVTAYFEGDSTYENSSLTTSLEIVSTVKANDITKYYKGSTKYSAKFFDSQGEVLANRVVSITVNGKKYTKKTNKNGVVSLAVNLKPGTYKVVSTDPITGYKLTTIFKILSTISGSSIKKVAGDSKRLVVKFFKSNGKLLAKKYIKYKLKGKIHKVKTSSKGKVSLKLKKLKKGTYKIVFYNKDGLSKSFKVKIFKRKASTKLTSYSYTFLPDETREIKVKFTTALKDDSISKKVIKIKINGKTYSKKTNGDGIVYLKLPSLSKGLYKVQYSYAGTKFFKASKSTNYVTILDTTNTSLAVKSTTRFGKGAGTLFKVALTAGRVPLIKKTVTFHVNGEDYSRTTDEKGIASLPINLGIGDYTVNYTFSGDSIFNKSSESCDIEVFERNNTKLTWKSGSSFKDSSQSFKVLLRDSKGKALAGLKVELTVDSQTYKITAGSNGYAKLKTYIALGKYKVRIKFPGNNNFVSSSVSKKVNVKLSKFRNGFNQKAVSKLKAYLKSSKHCKVGTKKIKKLVKSLTKGLTSKIDKAKALFKYVRDHIRYSFYYDTRYGASGTLKVKKANCVDTSHLMVSMFRTAGLKARYVHGVCKFSSGTYYGHVWTQVLLGKYWVCADASGYGHSLGKVNDWSPKSLHLRGIYRSLPF